MITKISPILFSALLMTACDSDSPDDDGQAGGGAPKGDEIDGEGDVQTWLDAANFSDRGDSFRCTVHMDEEKIGLNYMTFRLKGEETWQIGSVATLEAETSEHPDDVKTYRGGTSAIKTEDFANACTATATGIECTWDPSLLSSDHHMALDLSNPALVRSQGAGCQEGYRVEDVELFWKGDWFMSTCKFHAVALDDDKCEDL